LNKFLLTLFAFGFGFTAKAEFKVPTLQGPVMDMAGYISAEDQQDLSRLLYDYNKIGRAQIQVLVIPDLQGEEIETASIKITDAWKLGDKKKDNGILFLISAAERKMRIEVGQGLEGTLPDVTAKRIISDEVIPFFKARRTSDGIRAGVYGIISAVDKDYAEANNLQTHQQVQEDRGGREGGGHPALTFIIFIVILIFLIGGGRGGTGLLIGAALGGMGGRGGDSGGGGGWSGGGGGFSGGGASGSW
jgi:uncharacterized protein